LERISYTRQYKREKKEGVDDILLLEPILDKHKRRGYLTL
jgi:hypothetical protein